MNASKTKGVITTQLCSGTSFTSSNLAQVQVGDIVQFSSKYSQNIWTHSAIVVAIYKSGSTVVDLGLCMHDGADVDNDPNKTYNKICSLNGFWALYTSNRGIRFLRIDGYKY